ncbi:hypothetical protein NONO_c47350 [Nocardia nova SH22a]|uniref:Uncharacterized protein n=1 Tax=Nocardia nova SH22a TaxID=1415166 RepID=W5TK31_9NOCA|nr:hypothetical protein NONO_c47350 [Nocardia nova SH22a]
MGFVFNRETVTWLNWVEPQRVQRQVDRFVGETLRLVDLPAGPVKWWNPPLRGRLERAVRHVFPDMEAFTARENREIADQFICFMGDMFIRRADMTWVNVVSTGLPLYSDIGPCVRCRDTRHVVSMVDVARSVMLATEPGRFGEVWSMLGRCVRPGAIDGVNSGLDRLTTESDRATFELLIDSLDLDVPGEHQEASRQCAEYARAMDSLPPDVADILRRSFPSAGEW